MTRSEEVIYVARLFKFVRETQGQNKGLWVGMFQYLGGGDAGFSWCCYFACTVLAIVFGGFTKSPIGNHGLVQDVYTLAKAKGWLTDKPQAGDLFLYVDSRDHAHHIGIVTYVYGDGTILGIAGNTSPDGASSNGTGVFEHLVTPQAFIQYPRGQ